METSKKSQPEEKGKSPDPLNEIDTPVPPQVQYPLEAPDSKKNQQSTPVAHPTKNDQ